MLMTFKKLVCQTDFSDASRLAVDVAADLAAGAKGQLCLIHVVEVEQPLPPDPNFVMEVSGYERILHAGAQRQLDALAGCFTKVKVRTSTGHGDSGKEILRIEQEDAAGPHDACSSDALSPRPRRSSRAPTGMRGR